MERVIRIKEELIEAKRKINYIVKHKREKIKKNVFTGYRSEAAIELDQAWDKYYALMLELRAACLNDDLIYAGIIRATDEEAKREKVEQEKKIFITIDDLYMTNNKSNTVAEIEEAIVEQEEIEEEKEMNIEENAAEEITEGEESIDEEFWRLVDKVTTDKKIDMAYEVFGDLSSLYNSKPQVSTEEIVIGEDEYININKLTYESQEIWKTIKGTDYQVSTKGNVRTASTKKEVKTIMTANNMTAIFLDDKWYNLSGLVYSMFNKEGSASVMHIDKNIKNNHILNLKKRETLAA